jgi:Mrp family chromosome partitioning ATPase
VNNGDDGTPSRWWPFGRGRSPGADLGLAAHRRLALQLHRDLQRQESSRSVLLATPRASAVGASGSAALARCLADELSRPVLLMDASLWRPDLTRLLDCTRRPGFADVLVDPETNLADLVVPTTHKHVSFLPAGTALDRLGEAAPHDGIGELLETARLSYDFVVVFGRSVLDDSVALALAPCVGCVLLMVVEKQTTVEDLDAAQGALSACHARKVGLVLTTPSTDKRWSIKGAPER